MKPSLRRNSPRAPMTVCDVHGGCADCPQQIASAQLSVRLASSAITTHIQSIKTTRIRFDHDGEVADTQQARARSLPPPRVAVSRGEGCANAAAVRGVRAFAGSESDSNTQMRRLLQAWTGAPILQVA